MPLSNDQMKPERYLRWARARRTVAEITKHLEAGHTVAVTNYLRSTRFKKQHVGMFRATRSGHVEIQRGKSWDSINGCRITVFF